VSIFITREQLLYGLSGFFGSIADVPVQIHSDIFKIGIVEKLKPRAEICEDYLKPLIKQANGRTLLFPTFNYDFCRDGIYDRQKSPGQVGALSEYLSREYAGQRTRTPIFNFCIIGEGFDMVEKNNPFGENSTFAEVNKRNGVVAFLGAGFETNTYLHYMEESLVIGYRYLKPFKGKIIDNSKETNIELKYRVRPLIDGSAEYDWPRLITELKEQSILKQIRVGNGLISYFESSQLFEFWWDRIKSDELFLLTDESRQTAQNLYAKHGQPLTYEKLEPSS
jgi:aminoglycoside 3-N-acetyltransferase